MLTLIHNPPKVRSLFWKEKLDESIVFYGFEENEYILIAIIVYTMLEKFGVTFLENSS